MFFIYQVDYVYTGEVEIEDGKILKVFRKKDAMNSKVGEFTNNLET